MEDEIDLSKYLRIIAKYWVLIIIVAGCVMTASYFYYSVQPLRYSANSTLLVRSSSSGGMSSMQGMSGIAGMGLNASSNIDDLILLAKSRSIAEKVFNDFNGKEVWDYKMIGKNMLSVSLFQKILNKPERSGNQIIVNVIGPDPKFVVDATNSYVNALYYFWNKLNVTEARKKKEYIETQLPRAKWELRNAEEKYKQYTKISSMNMLGENSASYDIGGYAKELELKSSIYNMLLSEYESVKLDEAKDLIPFSIIDTAEAASQISGKNNLLVGLVGGLIVGVILAFFIDQMGKSGKKG